MSKVYKISPHKISPQDKILLRREASPAEQNQYSTC